MSLESEALERIGEIAAVHGAELLGKWLAGNMGQEEAKAMLDAQYEAARVAADAVAAKLVEGLDP